jgi:hypothetical protein
VKSETKLSLAAENVSTEKKSGRIEPVNQVMGLCSNCNHRFNCQFSKAEGGVWNCEEYE